MKQERSSKETREMFRHIEKKEIGITRFRCVFCRLCYLYLHEGCEVCCSCLLCDILCWRWYPRLVVDRSIQRGKQNKQTRRMKKEKEHTHTEKRETNQQLMKIANTTVNDTSCMSKYEHDLVLCVLESVMTKLTFLNKEQWIIAVPSMQT